MLRAVSIEADASVADLLRGRVAVDQVVVTGGKPRARRSHRMPGGHSPEMLKKAINSFEEARNILTFFIVF